MIKCIVSDLDGTLLHEHQENLFDLASKNHDALLKCVDEKIKFVIASGRSVSYGQRILSKYYSEEDYVVGGLNGGMVYIDKSIAYILEVEYDDMVKMFNLVKQYPKLYTNIQVQGIEDVRYYYNLNEARATFFKEECQRLKIGRVCDTSLDELISSKQRFRVGKFLVFTKGYEETMQIQAILEKEYQGKYHFTGSSPTILEVNHINATKGNFVAFVMDRFNYQRDEVAVIGDSFNDESMFEVVKHSFCMAQGEESLRQKAKYIVDDVASCVDLCLEMNKKKEIV